MIKVKNLYHSYHKDGNFQAKDVSFEIKEGEVFGFLGPSGAGKSTVQNILTGLLPLQKGQVTVDGYDLNKVNNKRFNRIGVSFEQSNVYSKLTALQNLKYYGDLFDVPTRDPEELLKLVGLEGRGNDRAGSFSKGMKHRLTFARSMINNPKIWFLDEPTTGLDPTIAATIKGIIRSTTAEGTTSFLTTHNMYIADELCDRVAFIIDGEIKLIDTPENLKQAYGKSLVEIEYIKEGEVYKESLKTVDDHDKEKIANIIKSYEIKTMHSKEATLEEIFIQVTGRGLI